MNTVKAFAIIIGTKRRIVRVTDIGQGVYSASLVRSNASYDGLLWVTGQGASPRGAVENMIEYIVSELHFPANFAPSIGFCLQTAIESFNVYGKRENGERLAEWLSNRYGVEVVFCEGDGRLSADVDYWTSSITGLAWSSLTQMESGNGRSGCDYYGTEEEFSDSPEWFWCERADEWFHCIYYSRIEIDGETYALQSVEDDVYFWESDNEWHWEPEEDDRDDDGGEIPGYHSKARPLWWRSGVGYGLEIEAYFPDRQSFYHDLPSEILAETDGSLCSYCGLEMIGGPYSLKAYQSGITPWGDVCKLARDHGGRGFRAGEGYGIHVNMSRALFKSSLHLAKFVVAMNTLERLGQVVAQRKTIYNGRWKSRTVIKKHLDRFTSKYEPVNVQDHRVEVRIFRSNLDWSRVLKNIEFCDAVRAWTNQNAELSVIPFEDTATPSFLGWLFKAENRTSYPSLVEFLGTKDIEGNSDLLTPSLQPFKTLAIARKAKEGLNA
jgi:hypothetical protein